jgi:hypothetical protein
MLFQIKIGLNGNYYVRARSARLASKLALECFNRQFNVVAHIVEPVTPLNDGDTSGLSYKFYVSYPNYVGWGYNYQPVNVPANDRDMAVIWNRG